jgi:hypothetical protein
MKIRQRNCRTVAVTRTQKLGMHPTNGSMGAGDNTCGPTRHRAEAPRLDEQFPLDKQGVVNADTCNGDLVAMARDFCEEPTTVGRGKSCKYTNAAMVQKLRSLIIYVYFPTGGLKAGLHRSKRSLVVAGAMGLPVIRIICTCRLFVIQEYQKSGASRKRLPYSFADRSQVTHSRASGGLRPSCLGVCT